MCQNGLMFRCVQCGTATEVHTLVCAICGAFETVLPSEEVCPPDERPLVVRADKLPARRIRRVLTGRASWDDLFKDPITKAPGIVLPSSALVYGEAGVGKTTTLTAVGAHLAGQLGGGCLFASAEMSREMVAHSARFARADLGRLWLSDEHAFEALCAFAYQHRPKVVVWDSAQGFAGGVRDAEGEAVRFAKEACAVGRRIKAITFIVSQINKDGTFRGSNEMVHEVDASVRLFRHKGQKRAEMTKHRFGQAPYEVADEWDQPTRQCADSHN